MVERPGRPLVNELLDMLSDKQLLLVLDNCEHVLSTCTQLAETLLLAPSLSILATSREPLGVAGEMLYPVSPMALPSARLPVENLALFDPIQLFVERANATYLTLNSPPRTRLQSPVFVSILTAFLLRLS